MASSGQAGPERDFDDLSIVSVLSTSAKVGSATGAAGLLLGSVAGILRSSNPVLFSISSGVQCFGLGSVYATIRQTLLAGQAQTFTYHRSIPIPQSPGSNVQSFNKEVITTHSPRQTAVASAVSGALAGAGMGALRSRANIVPGAIVWGAVGLAGQVGWSWREGMYDSDGDDALRRRGDTAASASRGGNLTAKLAAARSGAGAPQVQVLELDEEQPQKEPFWVRWTPMKMLSDKDYETMITERLVKVNADIAIIDEDLEKLRREQRMREDGSGSSDSSNGKAK